MRLFVGIPLPEDVRARLGELKGGLQGARWVRPGNLHLSLRFIGEVPGGGEADIDEALAAIEAPAFPLTLSELGCFDRRGRVHAVWAGVGVSDPLMRLRAKVEHALVRLDHEPEHRKFKPHVTLARMKNGSASEVGHYLEALNGFSAGPFEVDCFTLYRSHLGHGGAHYQALADYGLEN
ncbi:MAG: RNA 2',3'-cyclic phosphodiesterase [Rhodospirillaceae bacterium]|nr:RNA 2',3'-cyclic phosphodiesterase [Rhodospirillaceae bacterium]